MVTGISDFRLLETERVDARCRPEQLMSTYSVTRFSSASEFLYLLAGQKGQLKKGGVPDMERAARNLVQDWNTGKIPFYTLPPEEVQKSDAVILAQATKLPHLRESACCPGEIDFVALCRELCPQKAVT